MRLRWPVPTLQDEPAQVFILRQGLKTLPHVGFVDDDVLFGTVRGIETEVFEHALEDRVQPPGTYVLGGAIHVKGDVGHGFDGRLRYFELDSFRAAASTACIGVTVDMVKVPRGSGDARVPGTPYLVCFDMLRVIDPRLPVTRR